MKQIKHKQMQDATLINVRSLRKALAVLEARVDRKIARLLRAVKRAK